MSSSVKVAVRVRPFNDRESQSDCIIAMREGTQTAIRKPHEEFKQAKVFTYDHSYWSIDDSQPYASQGNVFEDLGLDVLNNAFEGYNCCIFAYGQTGSGKSYTMLGYGEEKGIIPLLCETLFDKIDEKKETANKQGSETVYTVEVSFMEIYNEKIHDLLDSRNKKPGGLKVRNHPKTGPYVEDLSSIPVASFDEIDQLMDEGTQARTVASTNMNATSSRSHAVFTIIFSQTEVDPASNTVLSDKVSKINLVDLAGSERQRSTGAENGRLKEGANINLSLSTLGKVIHALAENSGNSKAKLEHVPYRESNLTWLLKDSLGGNSKTIMIATLSPASINYEETLSTLRYADSAKRIVNTAVINEDPKTMLIKELQSEVSRLKQMLQKAGILQDESETIDESPETKELKEKLNQSEKLVQTLNQTWEQKLKQAQELKEQREKKLEGISMEELGRLPNLVNLNEDPLLNESLIYYLKEGETKIGRSNVDIKQDIELDGLGILSEHCIITNNSDVVSIKPVNKNPNTKLTSSQLFINGVEILEECELTLGMRVTVGFNYIFRFNHPTQAKAIATKKGNQQIINNKATIDWKFAVNELQEKQSQKLLQSGDYEWISFNNNDDDDDDNLSFPVHNSKNQRSRELGIWVIQKWTRYIARKKLNDKIGSISLAINEANGITVEKKIPYQFSIQLKSRLDSHKKNQKKLNCYQKEIQMTEVCVAVKNLENFKTKIWTYQKFVDKFYEIRENYQESINNDDSNEEDDFSQDDQNQQETQIQEKKIQKEKDSFEKIISFETFDSDDDEFESFSDNLIGIAYVYLKNLSYLFDIQRSVGIVSPKTGETLGIIKVNLIPKIQTNEEDNSINLNHVAVEPNILLHKALTIQISIEDIEFYVNDPLPEDSISDIDISFSFNNQNFNEILPQNKKSTGILIKNDFGDIDQRRHSDNLLRFKFDYSSIISISDITTSFLSYLDSESIAFKINAKFIHPNLTQNSQNEKNEENGENENFSDSSSNLLDIIAGNNEQNKNNEILSSNENESKFENENESEFEKISKKKKSESFQMLTSLNIWETNIQKNNFKNFLKNEESLDPNPRQNLQEIENQKIEESNNNNDEIDIRLVSNFKHDYYPCTTYLIRNDKPVRLFTIKIEKSTNQKVKFQKIISANFSNIRKMTTKKLSSQYVQNAKVSPKDIENNQFSQNLIQITQKNILQYFQNQISKNEDGNDFVVLLWKPDFSNEDLLIPSKKGHRVMGTLSISVQLSNSWTDLEGGVSGSTPTTTSPSPVVNITKDVSFKVYDAKNPKLRAVNPKLKIKNGNDIENVTDVTDVTDAPQLNNEHQNSQSLNNEGEIDFWSTLGSTLFSIDVTKTETEKEDKDVKLLIDKHKEAQFNLGTALKTEKLRQELDYQVKLSPQKKSFEQQHIENELSQMINKNELINTNPNPTNDTPKTPQKKIIEGSFSNLLDKNDNSKNSKENKNLITSIDVNEVQPRYYEISGNLKKVKCANFLQDQSQVSDISKSKIKNIFGAFQSPYFYIFNNFGDICESQKIDIRTCNVKLLNQQKYQNIFQQLNLNQENCFVIFSFEFSWILIFQTENQEKTKNWIKFLNMKEKNQQISDSDSDSDSDFDRDSDVVDSNLENDKENDNENEKNSTKNQNDKEKIKRLRKKLKKYKKICKEKGYLEKNEENQQNLVEEPPNSPNLAYNSSSVVSLKSYLIDKDHLLTIQNQQLKDLQEDLALEKKQAAITAKNLESARLEMTRTTKLQDSLSESLKQPKPASGFFSSKKTLGDALLKSKEATIAHQTHNSFLSLELKQLEEDSSEKLNSKDATIQRLKNDLLSQTVQNKKLLDHINSPKDNALSEKDLEDSSLQNQQLQDLRKKYFLSLAVSAKLQQMSLGNTCNVDVAELYKQSIDEHVVDYNTWPSYIATIIKKK